MKKRFLAGLLGFALTFTSLAGCTSTSTQSTDTSESVDASSESDSSKETNTPEESVAESTAAYTAGTYTGNSEGMAGNVEVLVTFSENEITDIQIGEQNETSGICETVYEVLPAEIIEYQSLAVDSISGATVTSAAVKSAVEDAVTQAGGDVSTLESREVPSKAEDGEYEYDVVVAGGGLSGLMAAYEAANTGAKVALIEKNGILGGTSITASGIFACADTDESVDAMYEAWQTRNSSQENNTLELDMVRALCEASPSVISLLEEAGVEYNISTSETTQAQTFSASANEASIKNAADIELASKDASAKGAAQLIEALVQKCEDVGVEIYLNSPGTSLVIEDGQVTGIISETKEYGTKTFQAKAVVLATGDYAQNEELTAQINPRAAGEYSATAVGNTGDGITMALSAGGVLDEFQESMSGVFTADPYNMPTIGDRTNPYPFESIVLTMDGERVFKEDGGSHQQMVYFIRDTELDTGWCVMDQETADKFVNLDEYLEATANGSTIIKAYKQDSLDALAADMGVDADTLIATVEEYNKMCEQGEDTDFGKAAEYLSAIDDGTYYAVLMYDGTRGNYGGIVTNTEGAVVDADGNPITGLYAGGIISSGAFFGDYYPGGQALAVASHMGYIAGSSAAEYALNN